MHQRTTQQNDSPCLFRHVYGGPLRPTVQAVRVVTLDAAPRPGGYLTAHFPWPRRTRFMFDVPAASIEPGTMAYVQDEANERYVLCVRAAEGVAA